jgi:hypothetical protein
MRLLNAILAATVGLSAAAAVPSRPLHPVLVRSADGRNDRWGFVDDSGAEAVLAQFDRVSRFVEGRAIACVGDCWSEYYEGQMFSKGRPRFGFLDASGRWAIHPRFIDARSFSEGRAAVAVRQLRGGRFDRPSYGSALWGYVDLSGRVVVPPRFVSAGAFGSGLAPVAQEVMGNAFFIYIDAAGARRFGPFRSAGSFVEGLAAVCTSAGWGYINTSGQFLVPPEFDEARSFSEGFAPVRRDGSWLLIDTKGAIHRIDGLMGGVSDGLVPVRRNGRWGFVDPAGQTIVAPRFDSAQGFSEGLAAVRVGNSWGYIDRTGAQAIAPQFARAAAFEGGSAMVATRLPPNENYGSHPVYRDERGLMHFVSDGFASSDCQPAEAPAAGAADCADEMGWASIPLLGPGAGEGEAIARFALIDHQGRVVWSNP